MKEITGNIFDLGNAKALDGSPIDITDADAICVTTNGIVKANGELVMGAGIALAFAKRFPNLPRYLGECVTEKGNQVYSVLPSLFTKSVASFPTKHHWKDQSDLKLIHTSAHQLVEKANKWRWQKVILPRPGCGLGGLKWADVKAVIEPILDDRFYIITP